MHKFMWNKRYLEHETMDTNHWFRIETTLDDNVAGVQWNDYSFSDKNEKKETNFFKKPKNM